MKERTMLLVFLVHSFNSLVSNGRHSHTKQYQLSQPHT